MQKQFNDVGLCVPSKHFMVDTSQKLEAIMKLIEYGKYFTLNRPRQFGKTTTLHLLYQALLQREEYFVLRMSFEVAGDKMFENPQTFSKGFLRILQKILQYQDKDLATYFKQLEGNVEDLEHLGQVLSEFVGTQGKKVVLMIDEVDKSSNHILFLHFLGMLRDNYLLRDSEILPFFQSIILIGVHDIKNLKQKIHPEEAHTLNSPWNIATDFTIDMSFSITEIQTMLQQYVADVQVVMDIAEISRKIYYYTSGYPYLVSKMCKILDEIITLNNPKNEWTLENVEESFRYLVKPSYTTTLFDDLYKNLNNNSDLYDLLFEIVINGEKRAFNIGNPIISLATTYGILESDAQQFCTVHNRIFEKRIYDMMLSKEETKQKPVLERSLYESEQGELLLKEALISFQNLMREHHSEKDNLFLEREGRLLFLSFLKPILNGKGFDFKEPVVGDERRVDIVITYLQYKYVIELKRWQGEIYHQKGLEQLCDYLDLYNLEEGYLLIYDFRKNKEYKTEEIEIRDKEIFAVWV